ncbi:hypothetical protein ScPMuIL_014890 [Solemya velum]
MENNIVKEFKNLHVFTSCTFVKMDQLVQDLTNALEESSKSPKGHGGELLLHASLRRCPKKRRERKRSHARDGIVRSEASESSLDEALRDYMESVAQLSDSDDMVLAHHITRLTMPLSGNFVPQVESDSVNENISPMRPQRRRKKYKSMAIDLDPILPQSCSSSNSPHPKLKQKLKSRTPRIDDGFIVPGQSAPDQMVSESNREETVPGKRKRTKTKLEYNALDAGNHSQVGDVREDGMDLTWYSQESSSVSSSESDGIVTNDEAREADDEQSDCGVSGIIPWWENENAGAPEMETEERLQQIITGSFEHIPRSSQLAFKERISKLMGTSPRELRFGRRRLKGKMAHYTVSRYLQDRQKWKSIQGKYSSWQPGNGSSSSDIKRPRKTLLPETRGWAGEESVPIPESNIGNRMLQSMGWSPGMGLGPEGSGIKIPVLPVARIRRQGLGCDQSTSDS